MDSTQNKSTAAKGANIMFSKSLKEKNPEAIEILKYIPADFLAQENKHGFYEITGKMIFDRLISIKIIEGIRTGENSCAMKFKLEGITIPQKKGGIRLQAMQKGVTTAGDWLTGFKSLAFELDDLLVEKELLTNRELMALCNHSDWYQSVGNNDYYTNYSKTRMYFLPRSESSRFIFDVEPRVNPQTQEMSVGMIPKIWSTSGWELIGNVTPTESVGSSGGQRVDSESLSLLED
jgi:hypothetical protein